jgi:hypothetical protein
MEALQMLKFALKQSHLNFTEHWITPESMLREQEPELGKDLLADLLGLDPEDVIDKIIQEMGEDDDK